MKQKLNNILFWTFCTLIVLYIGRTELTIHDEKQELEKHKLQLEIQLLEQTVSDSLQVNKRIDTTYFK